ncbi:MAG: NeuD/PglB/VioB family sugar acetyltransferase [Rhodocyclaceae bacterium]|nr:NeuD/PglB/VioB family sugar acetyltransferase [Rhodocyclaceae bacterium]MCA3145945.1 NeuD/PglB/VioB family sugar acetyltransferase [Rhodocyclaceae bacterium]
MKDIVLIGAGGHAASCIDVIEAEGRFRIVGLVGTESELHQRVCGYEVIATDGELRRLAGEYRFALITVGHIKSVQTRVRMYEAALQAGFELPVVVSPKAHVSAHARIGAGTIVMFGALVNANARVGVNCIINSRALVEHGAEVGAHCHVATGAILNGDLRLGAASFVGSGSVTKQGVAIGTGCVVGVGSVVRHDLADGVTYWGPGCNG